MQKYSFYREFLAFLLLTIPSIFSLNSIRQRRRLLTVAGASSRFRTL